MSYDLQVWSVRRPDLPACLPDAAAWSAERAAWTQSAKGSQISVSACVQAQREDIPDNVFSALPGIGFLTELVLSPIDAGPHARKLLTKAASSIAKASHGVVFDPQEETITAPSGVKRLAPLGAGESADVLQMSWWFLEGPLVRRDIADVLRVLSSALPEALPRRYGLVEPPQYAFSETGAAHFQQFVKDNDGVVWYPHSPVSGVYLAVPPAIGGTPQGYRSGFFEVSVDAEAFKQPGWHDAVRLAWRQISQVVHPFYGDVRTLRGWTRKRGRYWSVAGTEQHPVVSWWWAGVPKGAVHAAVLGPPYVDLWPAFRDAGEPLGDLKVVSTHDWSSDANALVAIGDAPAKILQQPKPPLMGKRTYPSVWPFALPFQ